MDRIYKVCTYIAHQHFRLNQYFKERCIFRLVYFGVLLTSRFSCCLTLQLFRDSVHTINLTMGNLLNSNGGMFSWMSLNPCSNPPLCFYYYTHIIKSKSLESISMLYFKTLSFNTTTARVIRGLTSNSKNVFLYAIIRRISVSANFFLLFLVSRVFHEH